MRSAGIVLAGGSSRRMGRPKQLLDVGGRPMFEVVVAQASASRLDEVLCGLPGIDQAAARAGGDAAGG
jgi:molybdenum cofactor cytidylyltransferase